MTIYTANIITATADALGDPEIVILVGEDAIVTYPLDDVDPVELLRSKGWVVRDEPDDSAGYGIVDVEPLDWEQIVADVTYARAQAQAELDRQDAAWRQTIRDAMNDDTTNKTHIAKAAGVTRERVYQIRDGRR